MREFFRTLIFVLILLALWVLLASKCSAQNVPLVRAQHDAFVSYYDQQVHNPALVVYVLEAKHFAGSYRMKGRHFKMDTQLPRPRLKDGDFANSGYVRGHLCSAGDRDSNKGWLKETYLTSNLVPMTMVCNSGAWKVIEDSCRMLALQGHRLLIGRGPLYNVRHDSGQRVLQTRASITIPAGFFCVAKCLDCSLHRFLWCLNDGTNFLQDVIRYQNDQRISVLLTNIFDLWCREEYETITR